MSPTPKGVRGIREKIVSWISNEQASSEGAAIKERRGANREVAYAEIADFRAPRRFLSDGRQLWSKSKALRVIPMTSEAVNTAKGSTQINAA
jgi:hypothetical protein